MTTRIRSTTVLCVRRDDKVVMAADGQVTLGHEVLKSKARKLRRLYNDKILAGFAGSTADAFALFSRFESKLEQFNGNLPRSVVELAKEWRTDRGRFPLNCSNFDSKRENSAKASAVDPAKPARILSL